MAGSSFFTLLDDIASVMDDVAVLSKVAAKKTSGVLGDDLALNAQQVSGVSSNRELPVVFAVAKGSLFNKVIIVPCALLISAFTPWLTNPLLMIGGLYLCFEGVEKVLHYFFPSKAEDIKHHKEHVENLKKTTEELLLLEKNKIKGAIRTDFILSAEIIVISLGTVASQPFLTRSLVLVGISLFMTVGVYGLVALIVKLDDFGLMLQSRKSTQIFGKPLLLFAPLLMKFLSLAGTLAMFLVGGGILVHGIPFLHHIVEAISSHFTWGITLVTTLADGIIGFAAGLVVLLLVMTIRKFLKK